MQYEGSEATAQAQPTVMTPVTWETKAKKPSGNYWHPGESVEDVYSQMTLRRFVVIPGAAISLGQVLGEGEYGVVYKGKWYSTKGVHLVAVKTLQEGDDEEERVKLLQEGAILGQFFHPNVVKLHGIVKDPDPVSYSFEPHPQQQCAHGFNIYLYYKILMLCYYVLLTVKGGRGTVGQGREGGLKSTVGENEN